MIVIVRQVVASYRTGWSLVVDQLAGAQGVMKRLAVYWISLAVGSMVPDAPGLLAADLVEPSAAVQFRHPVAAVIVGDGRQLVTANHRSGSISVLNVSEQTVDREFVLGKQLSDIVVSTNPQRLLITDEAAHELIAICLSPTGCVVEKRLAVSPYPVRVRINRQGDRAYVASLWSKTITVVDPDLWLSAVDDWTSGALRQIRLPFAPRELVVVEVEDQQRLAPSAEGHSLKLVVADAFGSNVAVIDPESGQVESVREIPAHAIRGLQLHPSKPRLLITHQMLSRLAHTTFDDVHWGSLLVNCLRSLEVADVLDPKADLLRGSRLEYLGGPERGAGDPGGFVIRPDETISIALSGTNELLLDDGNRLLTRRVKTGQYPTAIVISPDGTRVFVVNTLSDSITVIEPASASILGTIPLGPSPEPTAADRGEALFHSARLSHDSWFSCASCHVDGHTNGLLNDNLTDGSFGTAKRVLTLRGVSRTAPYAWTGRFASLADQIHHSVQSTMQGERLDDFATSDLEAYLRSLPPPPPVGFEDQVAIRRGATLFEKLDCRSCHTQPTLTSTRIVDVKLKDERGTSKFNPPSLRGVSQNGPYFHDGRAKDLAAVFSQFHHQLDQALTSDELGDLLAFLNNQ
jgi:YVTN family beta-propeller protein